MACYHSGPFGSSLDASRKAEGLAGCAQAHRLHTAEQAQAEYAKRSKRAEPGPQGAAAFNQKAIAVAYDLRSENVPYTQVSGSAMCFTG